MKKQKQISDSPHVIAYPPLIYIGGLLFGLLLRPIKPIKFIPDNLSIPLSIALVVIAIAVSMAAVKSFTKARTNVDVHKPTTAIVVNGPYSFSRNPIYLSMTLLYLGITAWFNELWLLITLISVILVIQYGVIKREENYLTKKFGAEYMKYKKSVRRWI